MPRSLSTSHLALNWRRFLLQLRRRGHHVDGKRIRAVFAAVIIMTLVILKLLQPGILGDGPTLQGGSLGRRIDNTHKRWLFYWRRWQYQRDFQQEQHQTVPPCPEKGANRFGVPVLLSTYYTETLSRSRHRKNLQQQVLQPLQQNPNQHNGDSHHHSPPLCPRCVFWPLQGESYRPLVETNGSSNGKNNNLHSHHSSTFSVLVPYLPTEMDRTLLEKSRNQKQTASVKNQKVAHFVFRLRQLWKDGHEASAHLWGLYMVYEFGGGYIAQPQLLDQADAIFWQRNKNHRGGGGEGESSSLMWKQDDEHPQQQSLQYAFSKQPKAWELECLWEQMLQAVANRQQTQKKGEDEDATMSRISWSNVLTFLRKLEHCKKHKEQLDEPCCSQVLGFDILDDPVETSPPPTTNTISFPTTTISEQRLTPAPEKSRKHSQLEQMLHDERCVPGGWWCHRCLRLPWRGSLASCQAFCRTCYVQHMTRELRQIPTVQVRVNIVQTKKLDESDPSSSSSKNQRIPRIIHQTWFEELTVKNYPHLQRLQNSWKASGWEYRFYTDDAARQYLQQHYPPRFADAYDALLPGAFKADLFRLLVLLKDGGIYADIDVQLDATSLDRVLPRHMSFFVPRDVPLDRWPHSNYCLWNGFMGAAPGHPIVARAVQDLMNRIENRWDYYDVERDVCGNNRGDCEIWKLRSIPVLILTGPCALGISINTALGRKNRLEGFELGWLRPSERNHGNNQQQNQTLVLDRDGSVLILLTDRYDMGELRFTDVDRSLLFASTNADQFASGPIFAPNRTSVHYSQSETDVMGSSNTYVDNWVSNEIIQVTVVRH